MKKLLFIMVVLFYMPLLAVATIDKEIIKQTDNFINSMPDLFKKAAGLKEMTPEARVNFVLSKTEELAKKHVADKMKEQFKQATIKFMQKSFRTYEFNKIAVPAITNSAVLKKSFDWEHIDSQIKYNVGIKMKLFTGALSTATITWDAYNAYKKGQIGGALKSIGGSISEMLAGAYIPGWTFISLGASAVKFTGKYILSYATDTKIEGVLESIYKVKSNPEQFANKIYKMSPSDIRKSVDDNWELIVYSGLYEGKGTEKGENALKEKIISTLISYRSNIVLSMKKAKDEKRKKTKMLKKYIEDTKKAKSSLIAVGENANRNLEVYTKKFYKYKNNILNIKEKAIEKEIAKKKKELYNIKSTYTPINADSLIKEYKIALMDYYTESPPQGYTDELDKKINEIKLKIKKKESISRKKVDKIFKVKHDEIKQLLALIKPETDSEGHKISSIVRHNKDIKSRIDKINGHLYNLQQKLRLDIALTEAKLKDAYLIVPPRTTKMINAIKEIASNANNDIKNAKYKLAFKKKQISEKALELHTDIYTGQIPNSDLGSSILQKLENNFKINVGEISSEIDRLKAEINFIKEESSLVESYRNLLILADKEYFNDMNAIKNQLEYKLGTNFFYKDTSYKDSSHWIVRNPIDTIYIAEFNFPRNLKVTSTFDKKLLQKPLKVEKRNLQILENYEAQDQAAKIARYLYRKFYKDIMGMSYILMHKSDSDNSWAEGYDVYKSNVLKWKTEGVSKSEGEKYLKKIDDFWTKNQKRIEIMQRQAKILEHCKIKYYNFSISNFLQIAKLSLNFPDMINKLRKAKKSVEEERTILLNKGVDSILLEDKKILKKYQKHKVGINEIYKIKTKLERYKSYTSKGYAFYKYIIFKDEINDFSKRVDLVLERDKKLQKKLKEKKHKDRIALEKKNARISMLEIKEATQSIIDNFEYGDICNNLDSYKMMFDIEIVEKYEYVKSKIGSMPSIEKNINQINKLLNRKNCDEIDNKIESIRDFYKTFKEAYESKDIPGILTLLSDDWSSSSDGADISDLEDYLGKSFRVFDEIRYNISNLNIVSSGNNRYQVSYDIDIVAQIYDDDITHEEKSSVMELVQIQNGKVKILKTLNGRFWSIR